MKRPIKLLIASTHPIQHFCPFYRALSDDERLDVRVVFMRGDGANSFYDKEFDRTIQWQPDLLQGFHSVVLDTPDSPSLSAVLNDFQPDVVQVYGFRTLIARKSIRWAKKNQRPILYISDSELRQARSLPTRIRKALTVPILQRQVRAFLTVGDENERYYRHYGAKEQALFRCPFPIDENLYKKVLEERDNVRQVTRSTFGIRSDDVAFLVVGKLTKRKAIDDVIKAFSVALSKKAPGTSIHLLIAGSGEEEDMLKLMARDLGSSTYTHFLGFVSVEDLPAIYIAADALIHPSSMDPHPLAISEAIFCGLPVIASDRVGSIGPTDDVRIDENGTEFPFGDTQKLSEAIELLSNDSELRQRMSLRSREIALTNTMDSRVENYFMATKFALSK